MSSIFKKIIQLVIIGFCLKIVNCGSGEKSEFPSGLTFEEFFTFLYKIENHIEEPNSESSKDISDKKKRAQIMSHLKQKLLVLLLLYNNLF